MFSRPLKGKSDEEKVSYLLIWVGDKGREVFATWEPFTCDDVKTPQKYYEKFKSHVQPTLNPILQDTNSTMKFREVKASTNLSRG
jgi:hypothetical protein